MRFYLVIILSLSVCVQVLHVSDASPELVDIVVPKNLVEFERQSHLFARDGRNPVRGCVSAIDGIAIRIRRPTVADAPNPIA